MVEQTMGADTFAAELTAIGVVLFAALAEWIHSRRTRRVDSLAFGPDQRPRFWARFASPVRVIALAAIAWGLVAIFLLPSRVHRYQGGEQSRERHLLLLLDVSPSMQLVDAGPQQKQSRRQRARDIIESFLQRVSTDHYKVSVLAFFNGVNPVVVDTKDTEVVRHVLSELPLYQAFQPGKTKLYDGLKEVVKVSKNWGPKSTSVIVLTDGDTEAAKGLPTMPASIANVLLVGVGDSRSGSFIAGKQSRQNSSALNQLATRLRGVYVDGNTKHIPSKVLAQMQDKMSDDSFYKWGRREFAIAASVIGALCYALLPVLLHCFGTGWQPGIPTTLHKSSSLRNSMRSRAAQKKKRIQTQEPTHSIA